MSQHIIESIRFLVILICVSVLIIYIYKKWMAKDHAFNHKQEPSSVSRTWIWRKKVVVAKQNPYNIRGQHFATWEAIKVKRILLLTASFGDGHNQAAHAIEEALQQFPDTVVKIVDYVEWLHPAVRHQAASAGRRLVTGRVRRTRNRRSRARDRSR